jgi:zona occludens toxin (predicted ATPase)
MVKFFSGTPGSGKSYHTAQEMYRTLRLKRNVISTVDIDLDIVSKNGRKQIGDYTYIPINKLCVTDLYKYAIKNHEKGYEGQTLLIIDECQIIFDSRGFQEKTRREWILFFSRHRHLGYNVILISQQDRMIDRQIRGMFEYEYKHRKINNFGPLWLIPWTFFVVIQTWYGSKHLRIGSQFILYRKKVARIYDSYTMYDDFLEEYGEKEKDEATEEMPEEPEPEEIPSLYARFVAFIKSKFKRSEENGIDVDCSDSSHGDDEQETQEH